MELCQSGCARSSCRGPRCPSASSGCSRRWEPGWQQRLMFHDPRAGQLFEEIQRSLAAELGGKGLMQPALFKGLVASGSLSSMPSPASGSSSCPPWCSWVGSTVSSASTTRCCSVRRCRPVISSSWRTPATPIHGGPGHHRRRDHPLPRGRRDPSAQHTLRQGSRDGAAPRRATHSCSLPRAEPVQPDGAVGYRPERWPGC